MTTDQSLIAAIRRAAAELSPGFELTAILTEAADRLEELTRPGWKLAPKRATRAMAESALAAHYGKWALDVFGIDGADMTANDKNYTFWEAFRRFWNAALKAVPPNRNKHSRSHDNDARRID